MRGLFYGGLGFAAGLAVMLFVEDRPMGRSEWRVENRIAELQARIREKEDQIRRNEAELEVLRAAVAEAADAPPAAAPEEPAAEIPAAAIEAASGLRVPDDALRAAFDAFRKPSAENVARLERHGADGFRALVALLRGGLNGTVFETLFERTWAPSMAGQERALIETADSDVHPWSRWGALRALGVADTPLARDYIVARLQSETDAGLFMCAAEAAGRMREARAVPDLSRGLRDKRWSTPLRGAIFLAAVEASGDGGRDLLLDYVREPNSDLLGTALHYLQRIDAKAAREAAAALLAGARADSLTGDQLAEIRNYVK